MILQKKKIKKKIIKQNKNVFGLIFSLFDSNHISQLYTHLVSLYKREVMSEQNTLTIQTLQSYFQLKM